MKELRQQFEGIGQVKGYSFQNIKKSPYSYLYEVKNDDTSAIHYEVFKRIENERFDCVSYPTDKAFGLWAWTCSNLDRAIEKFDELNMVIDMD
jgi:hypothetical protein